MRRKTTVVSAYVASCVLLMSACGRLGYAPLGPGPDGGAPIDVGGQDGDAATARDASPSDAARPDAGDADPGPADSGAPDAGPPPVGPVCIDPLGEAANTQLGLGQSLWADRNTVVFGLQAGAHGIQLFDVRDPASPVARGAFRTDDGGPGDLPGFSDDVLGIAVAGNVAYLATYVGGLVLVDISDVDAPSFLGALDLTGESWMVEVVGDRALVANHALGLAVVDVSDPSTPTMVTSLPLSGSTQDIHVDGSRVYAASQSALQIIDISAIDTPLLVGEATDGMRLYEVWGASGRAYASDSVGRQILTFDGSGTMPMPLHATPIDSAMAYRAIDGAGSTLVLGLGASGIGEVRAFDLTNPDAPAISGQVGVPARVFEVRVVGDLVFAACEDGVLRTYRLRPCSA